MPKQPPSANIYHQHKTEKSYNENPNISFPFVSIYKQYRHHMVYLQTQVQPKVKTAKIKSLNIHISLASHCYNSSSQVIEGCVMQGSHGYKSGLFIVLPSGLNW